MIRMNTLILYLVVCASTLQILDDSRHQIYYQLTTEPDFSVIQFTIITSSNGYFGIGFGSNTMMNADIVICNYSGGTCQCQDYWSLNEQAPILDTSQDVTTITALCSKSNNSRQYVFRRKLNTSDKSQDYVIQLGNQIKFIWAEGKSDNLQYHATRGNFQATLIQPTQLFQNNQISIFYQFVNLTRIEFTLKSTLPGSAALGYGSKTISGTDMTICNKINSQLVCKDYEGGQDQNTPSELKGQDSFIIAPLSYTLNNQRYYTFQRNTNNLNNSSNYVITLNQPINMIWSVSNNDSLIYRTDGGSFEGNFQINQSQESTPPPKTLASQIPSNGFLPKLQVVASKVTRNYTDYTQMDSLLVVDTQFSLGWKFNNDQTIDFYVFWQSNSWVGLGFGGSMTNTDMVIAQVQGNNLTITDAYSTGHSQPVPDAVQDLTLLYYSVNSTEVDFVFRRLLNTGDSKDAVLVKDGNYQFCYAYTSATQIEQHSGSQFAIFQVPLSVGVSGQAVIVQDVPLFLYFHGILFFIAWYSQPVIFRGIVADLGIFFVRYQKTYNQYINVHAYLFLYVDITTIIMVSVSLQQFGTDGVDGLFLVHQVFALLLLALSIIQHVVGVFMKYVLLERTKKNLDFILLVRDGHRIHGTILYMVGKINILIGIYYQGLNVLFIICIIWMISILFIMSLFEKNKYNNKYINARVETKLLPVSKDHQILINLLNSGYSRGEILLKLPLMNWVILNKQVYDVTGMNHPGGNYILELVNGREIGRFFSGSYGLETTKIRPHTHTQQAYKLLQTKYIGNIEATSIIVSSDEDKLTQDKMSSSSNSWNKVSSKILSKQVKQIQFEHKTYTVKNFQKGVEWFGKHFTLSTQEYGAKIRLYTTVVSMSEQNVLRRNRLLALYDSSQGNKLTSENEPLIEDYQEVSNTLSFIIKKYALPNALSAFIHDSQHESYVIKGPFGVGLELKSTSEGEHIAFVGGTGILPLLDLLDFLLQKAIFMVLKQANHPQANEADSLNNNLESTFSKGFIFKIFASFANLEEFIGYDWIQRLYQISSTHNLGLFDISVRYSDKYMDPVLPNLKKRFDDEFIASNVSKEKVQKVYVCGPPAMNYVIPRALKVIDFPDGKIIVV